MAALLSLLAASGGDAAWPPRGGVVQAPPTTYAGPCDLSPCAEAWSVSRKQTASYNGPAFQLQTVASLGSTPVTLDVGFTASGAVDMSTWSPFCNGVQHNCTYRKIYPQINAGSAANTMVPSTIKGLYGPPCNTMLYWVAISISIPTPDYPGYMAHLLVPDPPILFVCTRCRATAR